VKPDLTRFLNVDLELVATTELDALLEHFAAATITLRDSVDDGKRTVWIELAGDPQDLETAIGSFVQLVSALPPDTRRLWDACEDRCMNVGIQGGLGPQATAFRIPADALAALAAVSARLEFTVYAAGATPERR